jgi:hypothetical protein
MLLLILALMLLCELMIIRYRIRVANRSPLIQF